MRLLALVVLGAAFAPRLIHAGTASAAACTRLGANDLDLDIGINAASTGRACAQIGRRNIVMRAEDPVAGCRGFTAAIPPTRQATVTDAAGNTASGKAELVAAVGRIKSFLAKATVKAVIRFARADAYFKDPIVFSHPMGAPFEVNLVAEFASDREDPGLSLSTSGAAESAVSFQMSTNLTGPLVAIDVSLRTDEPLRVDVTLGHFVEGIPGWNEESIENELRNLLDAATPDNAFSLSAFALPVVPIAVPANETLQVFADTESSASAEGDAVPIPVLSISARILLPIAIATVGVLFLRRRRKS